MESQRATQLLGDAHRLWKGGQHEAASHLLDEITAELPDWAPAVHLSGLVARSLGDYSHAEDLMRRSLGLPGVVGRMRAEYANNLGHLLALAGHPWAAEAAFRAALEATDLAEARLGLANVLLSQDRPDEAAHLIATLPGAQNSPKAMLTWAEALARTGQRQAAVDLLRPFAQGGMPDIIVALARHLRGIGDLGEAASLLAPLVREPDGVTASLALVEVSMAAGDWTEAAAILRRRLEIDPYHPELLSRMASLAWMMGDSTDYAGGLKRAVESRPDDVGLRLALYNALDHASDHREAERVLRDGLKRNPAGYRFAAWLASRCAQSGGLLEARKLIASALAQAPATDMVREQAAVVALMDGDIAAATEHTQWLLTRYPFNQFALALGSLAGRLAGDAVWLSRVDPDKVCWTTHLIPPDAYTSIEAFNLDLAEVLRARHTLSAHPLMNSVRGGTQIEIDPCTERDPLLQAFFQMVEVAIRDFAARMPRDTAHPLFSRKTSRFRLSGCWTVRLHGGDGRHVSHIHPRGWLSSAYYVSLPDSISEDRQGWLSFGKPPYPISGLNALGWVKPENGLLALFPSYQWHAVEPYVGSGERLTIAFDVVPVA